MATPVSCTRVRAQLLALLFGLGCAASLCAQTLPFAGRWRLDAPAGAAAGPTALTIKDDSLSWSGPAKSAPTCVQQFVLQNERPGSVYRDGHGIKFVAGAPGSLPTYLLKLRASTCGDIERAVRISYPLVYRTDRIDVIEYVMGKPVSSRRFLRLRRKK